MHLRPRVICEPRGFTKILQLVFSISIISILFNYKQPFSTNINCKSINGNSEDNKPVNVEVVASRVVI